MRPIQFIELLRKTFDGYEPMSGGCFKLYKILKVVYPQANGWYNSDHVITEIDGDFYDIGGVVNEEEGGYLPFEVFGEAVIEAQFADLMK